MLRFRAFGQFGLMCVSLLFQVVNALIDFLYTGEMIIPRSDTADLQRLIETLKIDPELITVDVIEPGNKKVENVDVDKNVANGVKEDQSEVKNVDEEAKADLKNGESIDNEDKADTKKDEKAESDFTTDNISNRETDLSDNYVESESPKPKEDRKRRFRDEDEKTDQEQKRSK